MEIHKIKIEIDNFSFDEIVNFQQHIQQANRSGSRKSSIDKSGIGVAVMNWDDNCFLDDVSDMSDVLCNIHELWEEGFKEIVDIVGGDYMAWGLIIDKYLTIDKIENNEDEYYPYLVTFSLDTEALKKDYGIDVVMLEAE